MDKMPDTIYAWVWDLPYPSSHQGRADWSSVDYPSEQSVEVYVKKDNVLKLLNWIEDNVSDDFWEKIPVDLWNNVTVGNQD